MDLAERRAAILADHAAQVKYDPAWKGTDLAERPIAFLCDDEVVLFGECAAKVVFHLRRFLADVAPAILDERGDEPIVRHAVNKIRTLVESPPETIRVHTQVWNAYTFGLNALGVKVCLADGSK